MLSERDGRIVLREAFEAQGYRIAEDYPLQIAGLQSAVLLDGYDANSRVGYEYLTGEDGLEPEQLEILLQQAHCTLFLIDETRVPDSQTLLCAVFDFFRQLEHTRCP